MRADTEESAHAIGMSPTAYAYNLTSGLCIPLLAKPQKIMIDILVNGRLYENKPKLIKNSQKYDVASTKLTGSLLPHTLKGFDDHSSNGGYR